MLYLQDNKKPSTVAGSFPDRAMVEPKRECRYRSGVAAKGGVCFSQVNNIPVSEETHD
jgi:hypothetical protein